MLRDSESAATLIVRAAHFSCQTQDINCSYIVSAYLAARSFALFFNPPGGWCWTGLTRIHECASRLGPEVHPTSLISNL